MCDPARDPDSNCDMWQGSSSPPWNSEHDNSGKLLRHVILARGDFRIGLRTQLITITVRSSSPEETIHHPSSDTPVKLWSVLKQSPHDLMTSDRHLVVLFGRKRDGSDTPVVLSIADAPLACR